MSGFMEQAIRKVVHGHSLDGTVEAVVMLWALTKRKMGSAGLKM